MKTRKIIAIMIALAFIFTMIPTLDVAKADTGYGTITSAEELNEALGGNHTVTGNTVKLQSDVALDKIVTIKANDALILDMNGKTITAKGSEIESVGRLFTVCSDMTIKGNGTITKEKSMGSIHMVYINNGNLTFENGVIDAKEYSYSAYSSAISFDQDSNVDLDINGGNIKGGIQIKEESHDFKPEVKAEIDIRGGKTDCIDYDAHLEGAWLYPQKRILKIYGGEIGKLCTTNTKAYIYGGTIYDFNADFGDTVYMNGGKIKGTGLDIRNNGQLIMKKGTISSNDGEAVLLKNSSKSIKVHWGNEREVKGKASQLLGGNIITTKSKAKGIKMIGESILKVRNGSIKNTKKKGCFGIFVGKNGKLVFQGMKSHTAKIKGYKYGVYREVKAKASIKPHTKVYVSKGKKHVYRSGMKLPRVCIGNIVIKYSKIH